MNPDTVLAWVAVATLAIGFAAIGATLHGVRKQLCLQTFAEYTRRYGEIVRDLPSDAMNPSSSFRLDAATGDEREHVLRAARAYFNLCSEEFHLERRRMIDRRTWRIWDDGIARTMRLPWARQSWAELEGDYRYFPAFHAFLDGYAKSAAHDRGASA